MNFPSTAFPEETSSIVMALSSILEPISQDLKQTQALYQKTVLETSERDYLHKLLSGNGNSYIPEEFREEIADQVAHHLIKSEGKWIRAALVLLSASACGYQHERVYQIAVAVELIHLATLVHDDIIDEALVRRGHDTIANAWGNKVAVLLGDFLYCKAFKLLLKSGCLPAQLVLTNAAGQMCLGEIKQLRFSHEHQISEQEYFEMIEHKTASLMAGASASGLMLSQAREELVEKMHGFGHSLGMAFQIVDDVLDYTSSSFTMGKVQGGDVKNGKPTLPLIHLIEHESATVREIFESKMDFSDKTKRLLQLMNAIGSVDYAYALGQRYGERAKENLDHIKAEYGESDSLNSLYAMIDFILNRDR